jgi:hypothetical protein
MKQQEKQLFLGPPKAGVNGACDSDLPNSKDKWRQLVEQLLCKGVGATHQSITVSEGQHRAHALHQLLLLLLLLRLKCCG